MEKGDLEFGQRVVWSTVNNWDWVCLSMDWDCHLNWDVVMRMWSKWNEYGMGVKVWWGIEIVARIKYVVA